MFLEDSRTTPFDLLDVDLSRNPRPGTLGQFHGSPLDGQGFCSIRVGLHRNDLACDLERGCSRVVTLESGHIGEQEDLVSLGPGTMQLGGEITDRCGGVHLVVKCVFTLGRFDELRFRTQRSDRFPIPGAGGQDHQCRERADTDGVDEGADATDDPLPGRLSRLGCCVGDGGRSLPRLVGEESTLHADHEGKSQRTPDKSPLRFERREGTLENQRKGRWNFTRLHHQHRNATDQVQQAHRRNQFPGHRTDASNATDDHHPHDQCEDDAGGDLRHTEVTLGQTGDIPRLEHVATGDGGDDQGDTEDASDDASQRRPRTPLLAQHRTHHVHRSTARIVGIGGVSKHHRQGDLDGLERHAEETDHPHPEECSRPTERDRQRHATDVTETDRRRQSRRQRLEVADRSRIIGIVVDPSNHIDAVSHHPILGKSTPHGEEHSCPQQPDEGRGTPDQLANIGDEFPELVQGAVPSREVFNGWIELPPKSNPRQSTASIQGSRR